MWKYACAASGGEHLFAVPLDGHDRTLLAPPLRSNQVPAGSLFSCFAVEVLVVGLRVGAGMVDNAVPMIRRRIQRIEFQWNTAGIDDVVIRPGRDDYRETGADGRPNAIENRLARPFFHAKELVELVDFRSDL